MSKLDKERQEKANAIISEIEDFLTENGINVGWIKVF